MIHNEQNKKYFDWEKESEEKDQRWKIERSQFAHNQDVLERERDSLKEEAELLRKIIEGLSQ